MVTRIDIGPEGGPFVEIDEVDGGLVLRTPTDEIDLDTNVLVNAALGAALDANDNQIQNVTTLFATDVDAGSVDADDIDVTETATLPEANEGDAADERQIAVSSEGELLVATPTGGTNA